MVGPIGNRKSDIEHRLLVLRLSALGDVIHTMPAVVALGGALRPHIQIGWVVEEPYADLVSLVAPINRVFTVATRRWRRNPIHPRTLSEVAALRRNLRSFSRGGTSIDFQGLLKSALLGTVAGSQRRFGFAPQAVRERLAAFFYTNPVAVDTSQHVVDWNLALARAAGALPGSAPRTDYSKFAADPDGSIAVLTETPPVVLLPGSGRPCKQWNIDLYRLLAERLEKLLRSQPIVAWGPTERPLAEQLGAGGRARIAPPTNLRQLAFLLQRARLVVGADTGPLHLADALGTSVVGLFGPTDPRRNGPYGQPQSVVESYTSGGDMDSISVDAVYEKVREVLGE